MRKNNAHLLYLHLCATNTATGNSVDAVDEGYRGRAAVKDKYPGITEGPQVSVTGREYRSTLALFQYKALPVAGQRGVCNVTLGTGRVVATHPTVVAKRMAGRLNGGITLEQAAALADQERNAS